MNLNHINLPVVNVPQTQAFFEEYFGFRPFSKPSAVLAVMHNNSGMVLTISNLDRAAEVHYPEHFHIGFIQESTAAVDTFYQRLIADGFEADPPRRFHGSWTFYFRAPGGLLIEILA
ncbi:VOC family protein [Hymenobacter volaticus]|uniref:VOC family protein n=1 Tax=Hymenobacter volaticus TaxID=2932254 RepID=A0ABY4G2E2_9BACT|nr:VOC family protein [Hymenobacter volaticus]UOQ65001.1 VOC family protein [Hymenobacter volaticus]